MRKQYNIRWTELDREKIRKAITNFNRRLYRQKQANPSADWLPEKETYKHAIETIKTRADFNKYVKQLDRFNAKTAAKGSNAKLQLRQAVNRFNKVRQAVLENDPTATYLPSERSYNELAKVYRTTKDINRLVKSLNRFNVETAQPIQGSRGKISEWLITERNERVPLINEKRDKLKEELGEMPFTTRGKPTGHKVKDVYAPKNNSLEHVTADPLNMTAKGVDYQFQWMDRALNKGYDLDQRRLWQRNYIKGLMREGMPSELIELIMRIDPEVFAHVIDTDAQAGFTFIYDERDAELVAEDLMAVWEKYDTEVTQVNFDLDKIQEEIDFEATLGYHGRSFKHQDWYKAYAVVRKAKGHK